MATKFSLVIVGVLVLATASSLLALVSTWRVGGLFAAAVTENLPSLRAAAELELALLTESRSLRSFVLDAGNRAWLVEMRKAEQDFAKWMGEARTAAVTSDEAEILNRMESVHRAYRTQGRKVIALCDAGEVEESRELLRTQVAALYEEVFAWCEDYFEFNELNANRDEARARAEIRNFTYLVLACVAVTLTLGVFLLRIFWVDILRPLRSLASDACGVGGSTSAETAGTCENELHLVGTYLRALMSDAADARTALEQTRSQLMNAQKLASVGKLAAGVAHELRNPLTSIKMWLYSIQKAIGRDDELEPKFRTISEEITRMEGILRSFLEFSRPPALRLGQHSISVLLDKTLELVSHRIQDKHIRIVRGDSPSLPPVRADADQLRQVLVNVLDNAADAVANDGEIRLSAASARDPGGLPMVVVRIADTGSGMPQEVRQRVFEPFYTTKDEGTGLGLCIAARIMAQHTGRLVLDSSTPQGTTFAVWIPAAQVSSDE